MTLKIERVFERRRKKVHLKWPKNSMNKAAQKLQENHTKFLKTGRKQKFVAIFCYVLEIMGKIFACKFLAKLVCSFYEFFTHDDDSKST